MLLAAIFCVSFAALAFEVLLARVFAIGQWNHLSFMVISIALFGFGASGTFLSLTTASRWRRFRHPDSANSIAALLLLFSTTEILAFLTLNHLPLDYFRIPVEPLQGLYLLGAYFLLALPFFCAGLIISIGYTARPEKAGLVYFASMAGSALGAAIPLLALPLLDEGRLIILTAAAALIPALLAALKPTGTGKEGPSGRPLRRVPILTASLAIIAVGGASLTDAVDPAVRITPSPYKALGQILQFPKTDVSASRSGIRGRVDRVRTPYFRFAPGLSLKYTGRLPAQDVIFRDGDNPLVLYDLPSRQDAAFSAYLLAYAGYRLVGSPKSVLLIQHGGGAALACALISGAERLTIIEQNRSTAEMLRRHYHRPVIQEDPRPFLARDPNRYDVIHVEKWGLSIPGAGALNQDHSFTVEALGEYWRHLTHTGVIIFARKLLLPPSDSLRLFSTAYEALQKNGVKQPREHLALLRNFDTFTLLVSKMPVNAAAVAGFARQKNFDLVYLPGIQSSAANRFHVFEEPHHFMEINKLAASYQSGRPGEYFKTYLLDVKPQSDGRPFPGRFLKWSKLEAIYKSLDSRFYALLMSGEFVVSLVFIEALVLSVVLLLLPPMLAVRGRQKPSLSQVSYFLGIGAGFMLVELYLIKRLILIVGDPVISFTIVVAAILIFSGLGGLWVQNKSKGSIRLPMVALIGVLALTATCLELLSAHLLRLSAGWRYAAAVLLMLPAGFLMGMPLPLGMRQILKHPIHRAYAWSVNGCASVLSAIVAAQLAISWGITTIVVGGVIMYILAMLAASNE